MGEEEPISGSQGLELSRDDVAEGQADVAIWLQTEVVYLIKVSVYMSFASLILSCQSGDPFG